MKIIRSVFITCGICAASFASAQRLTLANAIKIAQDNSPATSVPIDIP